VRLSDAFDLGSGEIVAIVGGGGKTTAMYRLARETAAEGGAAIATGTTLFTPPSDRPRHLTVIAEREDELTDAVRAALERERCIIVATGHGTQGRLLPVAAGAPAAMLALRGVRRVIVEADGSRTRGFKAPGDHEPVIPDGATIVVAVAGMSALGQPLDAEHVHRPERVEALTGVSPGVLVTVEMMAAVLAHPLGGRKGVPDGARFAVLLNQVDARRIGDARLLGALLRDAGVECVVLAQAREDPPVVDVLR
jgi:molybdenum cofactor cytidylyltransferase